MSTTLAGIDIVTSPRTLIFDPPLTDEEFEAFCFKTDIVQFERTRDGVIHMHAPTGAATGDGNSEINRQLRNWWHTHRKGRVFDSNTGFFLPDGSMLSPDAAYLSPEKLEGLSAADYQRFLHRVPDFVIELLSRSDSLAAAQSKMELWMTNGATYGWLIDPYAHAVYIYQPGDRRVFFIAKLSAESGPVEGFTLDLEEVWRCYEV